MHSDSLILPGWLRAFSKHRLACFGLASLVFITLFSVLGPFFLKGSMQQFDLDHVLAAPSGEFLLGTDRLGRELLWQIMMGGRISLWVALIATLLATIIGCGYGIFSALMGGWVDRTLLYLLDIILAIPMLLIVIVVQALGESSMMKVILVIGLTSWANVARIVRTESCRLLQTTFIQAAITIGCSPFQVVMRHLFPNLLAPLIVVMTVGVGHAILLETTLSFLNLGIPITSYPSWGNIMSNGMSALLSGSWWIVVFPGLMTVITVLSINLIGDGLRDIVNPVHRENYS